MPHAFPLRAFRCLLLVAALMLGAIPAAQAATSLPDPLARGPYTPTTVDPVKLGTVDLQEPSATGGAVGTGTPPAAANAATVPLRGSLYYPAEKTRDSPVIILVHGNHASCNAGAAPNCSIFERNDRGYAYLGENLATWGYTVYSIDQDQLMFYQDNTAKGMHQRRLIIAAGLDALYAANQSAIADDDTHNIGSQLVGRLDFHRIGLMGHSRGGDAVASFLDFNRTRPAPGRRYDIRGVISLAPVDYERKAPYGTAYMTMIGYCDGDVSNLQGSRFYERSQYVMPEDPFPRIQVMLHGANHNWFNTTWFADGDDSTVSDPACSTNATTNPDNIRLSGGTYTRSGASGTYGSGDPTLMGDQEKVGLAMMSSFFKRYVGGDTAYDPYMTGELSQDGVTPQLPASACPSQTVSATKISCFDRLQTSYFAPPAERRDVIRPEPDDPLGTSAVGTALTGSGFSNPYTSPGGINPIPATTPGGYDWCNPEPTQFQTSTAGETGLPTATKGCPLPPATAIGGQNGTRENAPVNHSYGLQLALAWDNPLAATGTPATLATRIPAASSDVSSYKALVLATAVNFFDPRNPSRGLTGLWNPAATTQDFTIAVKDANGVEGTVSAASPRYGTALHQTVGNTGARVHVTLNDIRVPLGDFAAQGVDLRHIAKLELRFGELGKPQSGSIQLSDVRFQEAVTGPSALTDAAAFAKGDQEIADSPRLAAGSEPDVIWVGGTAAGATTTTTTATAKSTPAAGCTPSAAIASLGATRGKTYTLTGTATACTPTKVKTVELVVRHVASASRCKFLRANGTLGRTMPCSAPVGLAVHGTAKWSVRLKRAMPKGHYRVAVRVVDSAGRHVLGKAKTITIA
ncbi:alpha/beta hydrolase [Conexibacter woesei]|uniref:alpha/beta hydrolase n=1 Tax=Conexibacter woesei TaxID=191495 RepID=UPI001E2A5F9F|nr:alpha/beta hydrolase [Conexibacter woesei]